MDKQTIKRGIKALNEKFATSIDLMKLKREYNEIQKQLIIEHEPNEMDDNIVVYWGHSFVPDIVIPREIYDKYRKD